MQNQYGKGYDFVTSSWIVGELTELGTINVILGYYETPDEANKALQHLIDEANEDLQNLIEEQDEADEALQHLIEEQELSKDID